MKKILFLSGLFLAFLMASCGSDATDATAVNASEKSSCCSKHEHKGCSKHAHADGEKSGCSKHSCGLKDYDKTKLVEATEAGVGDITICPVSGSVYMVAEETPMVSHNGKDIPVCCASCAETYKESPEKIAL